MESEGSVYGEGNAYDFGARMYDGRIGRFFSIDPFYRKYPDLSDYVFVNSSPILYKDVDGRDWVYYDNQGNELGRTKSKWYHFHWMPELLGGGDKCIDLSDEEIYKGGFIAYVTFKGIGDLHSAIVDVKTGTLYEARHPVENGIPVDGSEYKDDDKSWYQANSTITKFEADDNYEFANKDWWNYKVKKKDGTYVDKRPDFVGVTYIWIPNRKALIDYAESRVGDEIDWTPFNNCKTFCRDVILSGFEGKLKDHDKEMKSILEDEDVHPGSWYNEFEDNKVIKNPDKTSESP